uniref:WD repeat domain 73 n=1 Tax=Zonotrichia albicollis TaxID=44394 RepID=A0A8D2NFJ3_ZONAL
VAGYGQSDGNEILQLIPPPTLLTKETQGLCPERDFKVECGGFSERPVYSLKYVPDTRYDYQVLPRVYWKWRRDLSTESKLLFHASRAPWVLHGSRLDRVQITEVESRKNVYTAGSEELSSLAFLDCSLLLLCSATGRLCLADTRQPQGLTEAVPAPSAPSSERWCMGTRHAAQGSPPSSQPVACLSSRGLLALTDLRKTSEFLAVAKARVPSSGSGAEFLCVSWAPALEGYLAVSGFDGTVHVYDTQSWDSSGREAEPIFVHKGHTFGGAGGSRDPPLVTVHTWHLQKPRTLLSAASDGSLHVWDWVQPCGKCG